MLSLHCFALVEEDLFDACLEVVSMKEVKNHL